MPSIPAAAHAIASATMARLVRASQRADCGNESMERRCLGLAQIRLPFGMLAAAGMACGLVMWVEGVLWWIRVCG